MNWTVTVPAWDSQQGYNANGTPALTVEQQAVALASCLQAGSREDAASHCRELAKKLDVATIPRATVAAALAALRKELADTIETHPPDEGSRLYDAATRTAVCGLDAVITRLGLEVTK